MIDLERVKPGKKYLLYTNCDLKKAKRAAVITATGVYTDKRGKKLGIIGDTPTFNKFGHRVGVARDRHYPAHNLCILNAEVSFLLFIFGQRRADYLTLKHRYLYDRPKVEEATILLSRARQDMECSWHKLAMAFCKAGAMEHMRDDDYSFVDMTDRH